MLQGTLPQLASGAIYTNAERTEWAVLHDQKLDVLESIIEELGGKLLLVEYEYQSDLSRLNSRFPHARKMEMKKDEDDWNRGDGTVPLMLIHPQSAKHGSNLQHGAGTSHGCHTTST